MGSRQQTEELDGPQDNEGSRRSAGIDGQQVVFREDGTLALKSRQVERKKSRTHHVHTQSSGWVLPTCYQELWALFGFIFAPNLHLLP